MKKLSILFLALVISVTTFSQNTETVLRTLNLPQEYALIDGFITDWKITRSLVIVQNVDKAKSVKTVSATGKISYSNAPTTYGYEMKEVRDELTNSGTYLPNFISGYLNAPKSYQSTSNAFEIRTDRIDPLSTGGWIGAAKTNIEQLNANLLLVSTVNELGGSQNVIKRTFVKRVGTTSYYKNPVDYLGRAIIGDTIYNQGAPASAMVIPFSNRVMSVTLITKTSQGIGSWSTSNPVWSGGVKVYTSTSTVLVPVADIPTLFGNSVEEIENELRTDIFCSPLNRSTHITSTSCEIVSSGSQYKGITYYSGVDASITRPSGKITSYNKSYPGHVNRWILKQWNQDGTTAAPSGSVYGQTWMKQYSSQEDNAITIVRGSVTSYDESTKTLTYNGSLKTELWLTHEELPGQGKGWGGEDIIVLPSNSSD